MANIKQLVENKSSLDYPALCSALVEQFGITEKVNWDSVLPAPQQQELFGGEVLRFIEKHPQLSSQKDIRPITLKKGSTSQMLFFYVCLADSTLPKKQIEQITKRFIKGADANRYIIWFFGNKEATELKVVLSAKEGKKVVLKTLPFGVEQPYYKTYDFILNEVAAKVQQLFVEPTDLWKALWKAFDISIINRRFYDEIKQAFDSLVEQIETRSNPFKNDDERVQFAIRLLGRIIFCWFLKRKGIIKEDAVSSSAIANYKNRNYYHELLEPLFFEVMNKPEKERVGGLPKIIAHYPFLNGGLFDANKETDFYDAETSTPNFKLQIENDWFYKFFSNTLEKYNFTVDENSSSNAEIAIDPEMLGRIFENLLAEQNPETGESARKATGSFYTPREIVDYMVEQSIAEYLKTALGKAEEEQELDRNLFGVVPNQQLKLKEVKPDKAAEKLNAALEDFVHTGHLPDELKTQAQAILDALNNIKVLDPACGSGAFPIGVLQKLIALKQEITQVQNPKKQVSQAAAYKLKLDTIQKSIYGVDIQPMAVELSRLRCWLSLVVDEEIDNIKALPNLDFKFVCADALVDVPENNYVKNQSQKSLEEFTKATEQYFNPDYKRKTELKVTIKKCLNEITNVHDIAINQIITQLRKERNSAKASRLKQLEKSLQDYTRQQSIWHSYRNIFENRKVEFFNIPYFFPLVKKGFDIVIANPPYGAELTQEQKTYFSTAYKHQEYQLDSYLLFIERGFNLLKPHGSLTYIIPNPLMTNLKLTKIRKYLTQENSICSVSHYKKYVFSAVVDTQVVVLKKSTPQNNNVKINIYDAEEPKSYLTEQNKWVLLDGDPVNIFFNEEQLDVVFKIRNNSIQLGTLFTVVVGMKPYQVGKGLPKQTKEVVKNRIFDAEIKIDDSYEKLLRGKDIEKYLIKWAGNRWIKYGDWLAEPRQTAKFDSPEKIVLRQTGDSIIATLDTERFVCMNNMHVILEKESKYPLKFLLPILNSKLIDFYYEFLNPEKGEALAEVKKENVERLVIKKDSYLKSDVLIRLCDYMLVLSAKQSQINEYVPNDHIANLYEELIDACVYELYFEKEVKAKEADVLALVEQHFKSIDGKEESEQVKIIQEGYQLLRDSHHEIRSRMTRQKLVEEIAIIQNRQA